MYELIKSKIFRPRQPWEKNLLVLWFGTFMAGIGFSLVMPFMPLYINTLGTFTHQQLNFWSGITFSSTFFSHDHCFSLVGPFSRPKRTQVNVITCFIRDGYRH